MTEMLKAWLTSAVAVSFLTAIAERLTPEGGAKRMQRVCCGLIWILVLFRPVIAEFRSVSLPRAAAVSAAIESRTEEFGASCRQTYKSIIESETATYIEAQAKKQGFFCTATVEATVREDGTGGIETVTLTGTCDEAFLLEIAEELEIDSRQIHRKEGDG